MHSESVSASDIENYLQERIANDLDLNVSVIKVDSDLSNIGLNSVLISFIEGDLEAWLQVEIPPAMLLQSANIRDAAQKLVDLKNTILP